MMGVGQLVREKRFMSSTLHMSVRHGIVLKEDERLA